MSERQEFKFGDTVENTFASERNPHRIGTFVRYIRRTGKMNPGIYAQITDRKGDFWEVEAIALKKIKRSQP